MEFSNHRTVEAFKAERFTKSLNLIWAKKKDENGELQPLYYKDANGKETTIKKIAVEDDAGNTVAWASASLAKDVADKGGIDASRRPVIVSCKADNGETYQVLTYRGQRSADRVALEL